MRVEVEIFSGQPNPVWELTAKESAEFLQLFQSLPKAKGGKARQDLGYRGLTVTAPAGQDIAGFDQRLVVSNGLVLARRTGAEEQFLDRDRALERWLLRTGKGRIDKALFDDIEQELNRK